MSKRLPPDVLKFFQEQGRKGGKIGGKKLAEQMTPKQRHDRAQKAGIARARKAAAARKSAAERSSATGRIGSTTTQS
jgi:hypothetical protein